MHQSVRWNPPTKELHLRLSSLSNVAIVPPASHSLALPSVYAAPFITVPAKEPTNGAGFRSTHSQSDSMIIPYLSQSFAPAAAWILRDMRASVSERRRG